MEYVEMNDKQKKYYFKLLLHFKKELSRKFADFVKSDKSNIQIILDFINNENLEWDISLLSYILGE